MTILQSTPRENTVPSDTGPEFSFSDAVDGLSTRELLSRTYRDLRAIARSQIEKEPSGHTLQATALVHEVFLRLTSQRTKRWENQEQFLAIASVMMRRILVDHHRAKHAAKRGKHLARTPVTVDVAHTVAMSDVDLVALNDAIDTLAAVDADAAKIVEMRYFGGMRVQEIARHLGVTERSVHRRWTFAKAWLARVLYPFDSEQEGTPSDA